MEVEVRIDDEHSIPRVTQRYANLFHNLPLDFDTRYESTFVSFHISADAKEISHNLAEEKIVIPQKFFSKFNDTEKEAFLVRHLYQQLSQKELDKMEKWRKDELPDIYTAILTSGLTSLAIGLTAKVDAVSYLGAALVALGLFLRSKYVNAHRDTLDIHTGCDDWALLSTRDAKSCVSSLRHEHSAFGVDMFFARERKLQRNVRNQEPALCA